MIAANLQRPRVVGRRAVLREEYLPVGIHAFQLARAAAADKRRVQHSRANLILLLRCIRIAGPVAVGI